MDHNRDFGVFAAVLGALSFWAAGCGEEAKPITIQYSRPAKIEVAPNIKKVAVSEFNGRTNDDKRWADIASDKLMSDLDAYNRQYHRYELVDRKRLKAIMDERDLRIAINDSSSAAKVGKLANVDAIIHGDVDVKTRDERATRSRFNPMSRTMENVEYTKRYSIVTIGFVMDDVNTGKQLATDSCMREFDSEKDKAKGAAGMVAMMGFGGDKLPPVDQITNRLVEECVASFLGKISPHNQRFDVKLARGKSSLVASGNKMAEAGDYKEALNLYSDAIRDKPDDAGAAYNAGVMYEALGDLAKALECYNRAIRIKVEPDFIKARARVNREIGATAAPERALPQ